MLNSHVSGHVFPRHCHSYLPTISHGNGCYLIDKTGKSYLDGSGGAAVSCLGHNHPRIIAAVERQLNQVAFAHTGFFTSEPAEALADLMVSQAPGDLNRCYFVSGGSEAMEAALKLARQYFMERGETQRQYIIGRHQSYHGNTLGALATGGNQWRRKPFEPLMVATSHIPPCYAYREQTEDETSFAYGQRAANYLLEEIQRLGPEQVMAFVAETVVGATAGAVPAVAGYFKRIHEICDQFGILLILDEVMCGMGRTGHMFAYTAEDITPDIVITAKGLGGGYQPIGAMMCSKHIYQTIADGSGYFQHGHTYMGHPMACAASLEVLRVMIEENLPAQVQGQGEYLQQLLKQRFADHPHVGDIRGRGLFVGIELVQDRDTKAPLDVALQTHKKVKQLAFANGLICYPMGGTVDGIRGDHILLAPPYIISDIQLEELVTKLATSVDQALL